MPRATGAATDRPGVCFARWPQPTASLASDLKKGEILSPLMGESESEGKRLRSPAWQPFAGEVVGERLTPSLHSSRGIGITQTSPIEGEG